MLTSEISAGLWGEAWADLRGTSVLLVRPLEFPGTADDELTDGRTEAPC